MKNDIINIVYVATNGYCNYAEGFFSTLKYFAPGRLKTITFLTNDHSMDKYKSADYDDIVFINVVHMFDLIYPCINLHKSYFIEQLPLNYGYIFYFDADTKFKEVPDYDWESMFKTMDGGNVLISKHPMYAAKENFSLYGESKMEWINNFFTTNMTEKDPSRQAYISADRYTYVISSFFAANAETMHRLNETIINMTRIDLTRKYGYHIPPFMDENYFNALVFDYQNNINNNGLKFSVEQYSELNDCDSEDYDKIFLIQKNFPNFKTNRR